MNIFERDGVRSCFILANEACLPSVADNHPKMYCADAIWNILSVDRLKGSKSSITPSTRRKSVLVMSPEKAFTGYEINFNN